jgi:hypothetical protein
MSTQQFHFTHDDIDDEFIADMQTVQNSVPIDVFKQLAQISIKLLTGEQTQLTSLDYLLEVLSPLGEKAQISTRKLANIVRSMSMFFQNCTKNNCKLEQVKEDCEKFGFDEEHILLFTNLYKKYFPSISRVLIAQTLSVNPLKDMDWRFGVTASSSELNQVGTTFLQLKLVLGEEKKPVFLELSLPQFYDFLHQMEKAKSSLDFFSNSTC